MTDEATHRAAVRALIARQDDTQQAHAVLELAVREPERAARVREEIAEPPKPRALPLDIVRRAYHRHNLHMPDQPRRVVAPKNLAELLAELQGAVDASLAIKAIGDGYGFANTGFTRGALIAMVNNLDAILPIETDVLRDGVDAGGLLQFEAGATIDDLNGHLWPKRRALFNQPGFGGLTYAGTMSCGGHGSGTWTGPLSEHVKSLHLITIDAQRRVVQSRIEPSDGITHSGKFSARHPSVDLVQDDALFHACTCAMGCLGVIYAVTIATRAAFNIRETRKKYRWSEVRDRLPQLLAEQGPGKRLHSIEVWINPYSVDSEVRCVLGEREETGDAPRGHRGLGIEFGGVEPLFRVLAWWMKNFPDAVPGLIDAALSATEANNVVLTGPDGLNFGNPNYAPVTAASGGVPSAGIGELADGLIAHLARRRREQNAYITSPVGLRFVKQARAHLSPAHGRDTCMIEVPILENTPLARQTLRSYHDFIYERAGGRPHWGQVNDMPAERLANMFPPGALAAFREAFRVLNPKGYFDNAFTEQLELRQRT